MSSQVIVDDTQFRIAMATLRREIPDEVARLAVPELRDTLQKVTSKVPFGPAAGGHVREAYYTGIDGGDPYIAWDRDRFPYAGWLQHGGTRGRPWVRSGRWFFPELGELRKEIDKIGDRAVSNVIERYGYN